MGKLKADTMPVWGPDYLSRADARPTHAKWPLKSQLLRDQDPALQVEAFPSLLPRT